MKNFLASFAVFLALAGCTPQKITPKTSGIATTKSGNEAPYLMSLPLKLGSQYFTPRFFSGDSRVLFGDATNSFSEWTRDGGLVSIAGKTPPLYNFFLESSNYDGTILVGGFTYPYNRSELTDYGLFRWTEAGGFEMLNPHMPPPPADGINMPSIQISGDGKQISFLCGDNPDYAVVACDLHSLPDPTPAAEKIWTEGHGIENLGTMFGRKFDYVRVSGDFNSYIVGTVNPPSLGRIDVTGHYIAFQKADSYLTPDDQGTVIMNRNASLIAYESSNGMAIWNVEGKLLPPLKLIPRCVGFRVTAIDDSGAFFGSAYCPSYGTQYAEGIGLRITSSGAQTIGAWLRSAGLPNNLSLNTQINLVSPDGKTVVGDSNVEPVAASVGTNTIPATAGQKAPQSDDMSQPNTEFIAHIP